MIGFYLRIAVLAATSSALLQAQPTQSPRDPLMKEIRDDLPPVHLRFDTSLVLIPTQVTRDDTPILNLKGEDFQIFEDGELQELSYFAQDDAPVSIGILLDTSASMRGKERKAVQAAESFFRTSNQADEFFFIAFDESARLVSRFTNDQRSILREISHTRPYGRTALFDAVQLGLESMKQATHRRKALIVLSDGADNRSRRTFAAIKNALLESDVQLYALGILEAPTGSAPAQEITQDSKLLEKLADQTGGQYFEVDTEALPELSARIGRLLRNEYLLGYSPTNSQRDGTYRRITVKMRATEGSVTLRSRRGYYAPAR